MITHTACLGGGTIGASWAALFLASGRSVALYDPAPDTEARVRAYIETSWPVLEALGLAKGDPEAINFHEKPETAVEGAGFIQESVPERLPIKHATYAAIENALEPEAIVASSASGLTLSQMQPGFHDPARLVLGHPFNPPHLIPLVEVMGNDKTATGVVEAAEAFYESCGKTTIRVRKEIPGHVANRMQAALWREAIHLVLTGVASVEDVDKAISAGPGMRWAAMGPTSLFNLAAGDGGIRAYIDHFEDTFNGWWDNMGEVKLNADVAETLADGLASSFKDKCLDEIAADRDALIVAMLNAKTSVKSGDCN